MLCSFFFHYSFPEPGGSSSAPGAGKVSGPQSGLGASGLAHAMTRLSPEMDSATRDSIMPTCTMASQFHHTKRHAERCPSSPVFAPRRFTNSGVRFIKYRSLCHGTFGDCVTRSGLDPIRLRLRDSSTPSQDAKEPAIAFDCLGKWHALDSWVGQLDCYLAVTQHLQTSEDVFEMHDSVS
jgi:hypothetical protein